MHGTTAGGDKPRPYSALRHRAGTAAGGDTPPTAQYSTPGNHVASPGASASSASSANCSTMNGAAPR